MMRQISFFVLFILIVVFSPRESLSADAKMRVLFIGNSLTSANDLPQTIAKMAKFRHYNMEYEMYAPGGYRFSQHAYDAAALKKINKGTWDFIILQEQSQIPAFSPEQVQREVYPYAKKLCEMIKTANPRCGIIFYETMARKNGDKDNVRVSPELATYDGTQNRLNNSYSIMARDNGALIAPVGEAWQEARRLYPRIELYSDDVHPNIKGTYLAACVFFKTLFNESPVGLYHPASIDDQTALLLQEIAEKK